MGLTTKTNIFNAILLIQLSFHCIFRSIIFIIFTIKCVGLGLGVG